MIENSLNEPGEYNLPVINMVPQVKKQNFVQAELCAFQESGHILFAYLCGYTCHEGFLYSDVDGVCTGFSMIDYGPDAGEASSFMNGSVLKLCPQMDLGTRLHFIEVGRRLARIQMGGSVTASFFKMKGHTTPFLPFEMDIVDYIRFEHIRYMLNEISNDEEENFFENGMRDALYTLDNTQTWNAVVELANQLLSKRRIFQSEIEAILKPII